MSNASDLYAPSNEEFEWLNNLDKTALGRSLREHFTCVDFALRNKSRAECPITQVADFRRVFCRAFMDSDRCFNLPRPTPKYMAIVNLSGTRGLLYSSRSTLIRLLCLVSPESTARVIQNVEAILEHAAKNDCSVLACLSMPWQSGVHSVHWDIRTIKRDEAKKTVRDGALCYYYNSEGVRSVASSVDVDMRDDMCLKAQVAAFSKNFPSCNLDFVGDDIPDPDVDERTAKLASIVSAVRADRERLIGELNGCKEDYEEKLKAAYLVGDERVATIIDKAKIATKVSETKMVEIQKHNSTLLAQNKDLSAAKAEAERALAENKLLFSNEIAPYKHTAKLQEMSAKSATEKLSQLQKSTTREREQMEKAHATIVSDLERRMSDEQLKVRKETDKLEQAIVAQGRLGEVIDQLRTASQAMTYENLSRRKKIVGLQCALAVACNEHSKCMAAAAINQEGLTAGQHELHQMVVQAEGAAESNERALEQMGKEMTKLKKDMTAQKKELDAERKKKRPITPPPRPQTPAPTFPTATVEIQTVTMKSKVDEELEELSERFVHLQDQLDVVSKERDALKEQAFNPPSPVPSDPSPTGADANTFVVSTPDSSMNGDAQPSAPNNVQHANNYQMYNKVAMGMQHVGQLGQFGQVGPQPPIDLGCDPNGDQCVEVVVGQLQFSMRAIVDMARQGYAHKHAADNMWSELQAMKRFTGTDSQMWPQQAPYYMDYAPPQPQPQQQWPGANGHSNGHSNGGRNHGGHGKRGGA